MVNWNVYCAIYDNKKRMEKIANIPKLKRHWNKRSAMIEKAEAFVIAECQKQHIRLCEQDMYETAFELYWKAREI